MPSLSDYLQNRYSITHPLAVSSAYQLQRTCRIFEGWLRANDYPTDDLLAFDELVLSEWIKWLEGQYAPRTVYKHRGDIKTILADARDFYKAPPLRSARIRCPDVPPPNPDAWTVNVAREIIYAARKLPGRLKNGVRRSVYFEAIYRCAWRLLLRRQDLWEVPLANFLEDGRVYRIQNKTKVLVAGRLGPTELELIYSMGTDPPLAWPQGESQFYYWSERLKELAGVSDEGHLQRFRKSAATDVARYDRTSVTKVLGHTTPAADAFYVDEKLLDFQPIEPTDIDGISEGGLRLFRGAG